MTSILRRDFFKEGYAPPKAAKSGYNNVNNNKEPITLNNVKRPQKNLS